ncbi:paraquat-inducible protein A [Brenneria rubrifaciens]|uniref:Uncharacterized protein n=1 Tax=Brenneria rubrifaciens TaxID=55213 RepID=A0A4P8QRA8_9GAMM|nr:paraquat-inducible protein A [Brenneria rubrifaciens]QCR09106.1 hypothetical protein EH207_11570 [Brenneria rubrifaciens]
MANVYPDTSVSFHSVQHAATVWQAAMAHADGATFPLAICRVFLLIPPPFLQIILFGWVAFFAPNDQCEPGFICKMKLLMWLRPWIMTDIGILGFLMAAMTLSGFLQVIPRPADVPAQLDIPQIVIQAALSLWIMNAG